MVLAASPQPALSPEEARARLAREWASRAPASPDEILDFYRDSEHLEADLDAFHASPERRRWTELACHVARTQGATLVVDIGAGAGHDLAALRAAVESDVLLYGVEPNDALRVRINRELTRCVADVADAPIGEADLLLCFDVLEHVVDPEAFLAGIATRAPVGCLLIETVATTDCGTPLHLRANRGWHPGRALRSSGWDCIDESGRLRVWKRFQVERMTRQPVAVCANREISVQTYDSVLKLMYARSETFDWQPGRAAESGLLRARSVWASKWYREYADDGFLMIDSDIEFEPQDAEKVVRLGRETRSIAVAAYPVRDGGHLAVRGMGDDIAFGADVGPTEIRYGPTGFMYVHRDVLDAMIPTLPLCHASQPWALWPMFDFKVVPSDSLPGDHEWLSEDWWFCERARELGFKVWLEPSVILKHWGKVPVTIRNMGAVHAISTGILPPSKE